MKGTMSIPEYARYRGVALFAVQTAVKSGRLKQSITIVNGRTRINPQLADKEWAANTNIAKNPTRAKPAPSGDDGYYTHRSRREEYEAKLAQLEYEQKSGRLVNVEDVETLWQRIIVESKAKLLGVPSKAKTLIPILTAADVNVIDALIREAMEELAERSCKQPSND